MARWESELHGDAWSRELPTVRGLLYEDADTYLWTYVQLVAPDAEYSVAQVFLL
jgi:hypothetical protein